MAFRRIAPRIVEAFKPLDEWFADAQKTLSFVDKLIQQNEPLIWTTWCTIDEFLWSIVDYLSPLPDVLDRSGLVSVGMDSWVQTEGLARRDFQNAREPLSMETYLSFLRKFSAWIYGEEFPAQLQEDLRALFSAEGWNAAGRDEWEIAMVLFRAWFELFPERPVPAVADPSRIMLRDRFPTDHFSHRAAPIDAQRAFFLGSIAVLMQLARRRESPVYFAKEFVDDEIRLAALLPVVQWPSDDTSAHSEEKHVGAVLYIRPEELPRYTWKASGATDRR